LAGGGVAPARQYIAELLDDVLAGRINPGLVFDYTTDLKYVATLTPPWTNAAPSRHYSPSATCRQSAGITEQWSLRRGPPSEACPLIG
jgi:hypothetical protein